MEKRLRNRVFKTQLQENCTFWIPGKQHWLVNAKKANAGIIQSYKFAQLQPSTLDLDLLKNIPSWLEDIFGYRTLPVSWKNCARNSAGILL